MRNVKNLDGMEQTYKEEYFYKEEGAPTESFRYCNYHLNQNGNDYDQFALVTNALYPYIRLAKKRGNSHYPCGIMKSPGTDGWYAKLTNEERDLQCPKIAWGFAAEFLANLQYDYAQKDYVPIIAMREFINRFYDKYFTRYLNCHSGLKYYDLTDRQKELDFLSEHETEIRSLWEKSEPLKDYPQLYEYAQRAEQDYESYLDERKAILQIEENTTGKTLDSTMDDGTYHKILDSINRIGNQFERFPEIVRTQNEECIRAMFLTQLNAAFTNLSSTGESFNHIGKTDIMVKHNDSVVFIAECKNWKGKKAFLGAIDQLLSYLTWRDSKTSLIVFVRQTNISTVINVIKNSVVNHSAYVSTESSSKPGWLNYKFRLPQDPDKMIHLAVQVFDFN